MVARHSVCLFIWRGPRFGQPRSRGLHLLVNQSTTRVSAPLPARHFFFSRASFLVSSKVPSSGVGALKALWMHGPDITRREGHELGVDGA